jgi:hypothetical protein
MLWVYYSAQIFLLGAEFTWVYSHALGSRRNQPRPGAARAADLTDVRVEPPALPVTRAPVAAAPGTPGLPAAARVSVSPALVVTPAAPASVHAKVLLRQKVFAALGVAAAVGLVAGAAAGWKARKARRTVKLAAAGSD